MRSYINSKGDKVFVSEEHLSKASEIKYELQKTNNNMRCSWVQHKRMMEKEGFNDSDINESYRCLIKDYQSKNGLITKREKMADIVSDSKLKSIKEAVGELYHSKREVQLEGQKLGKLKRELTLYSVVAEEISNSVKEYLSDFDFKMFRYDEKFMESKSKMVILISDWHIGAVIDDVLGNTYNYEVAKERISIYLNKIYNIAMENGVSDINVVCMGDMTEHINMRKVNQAYETEFTMSEQITKAFDLIKNFLVSLSFDFNVTYSGIGGNHDRMNGIKDDNIDGDSSVFILNYFVKEFINMLDSERLKYLECDDINYSVVLNLNNSKLKFVHGDNERKGSAILSSHNALDDVLYNVVAMGHLHHFEVKEVGQNRFEVYCGSLMGVNNYGKKGKFTSNASQAVILVDEYGEIDIRRIGLQNR